MAMTLTCSAPSAEEVAARSALHAFADRRHDGNRIQRRNLVEGLRASSNSNAERALHDARRFRRVDDKQMLFSEDACEIMRMFAAAPPRRRTLRYARNALHPGSVDFDQRHIPTAVTALTPRSRVAGRADGASVAVVKLFRMRTGTPWRDAGDRLVVQDFRPVVGQLRRFP
jgi:hypothetical protein